MKLTLFLAWFPILLAVGVGGRLLGRQRGYALGILCALFWVILVQAQYGASGWNDPWQILSLVAGSVALIAMGGWAGDMSVGDREQSISSAGRERSFGLPVQFAGACRMFDEWLRDHGDDSDPWPSFGEFVRMMLHQSCGATHVRLFRISADGASVEPLHTIRARPLSPAEDMIHNLTSAGTSRPVTPHDTDPTTDRQLPSANGTAPWRFSVEMAGETLGIVQVGSMPAEVLATPGVPDSIARLTGLLWSLLAAHVKNRTADTEDPVSGLLTRQAFLRCGNDSLRTSYEHKEPVAVAVIALERLRELNDSGRWESADELVHEAAKVLRLKARSEDCLGRFDGSRFVVLFRRVDARLAGLIVAQVMARLNTLVGDVARWKANIAVRCGVVGSGAQSPDLPTLVAGALAECHRARGDNRTIASGLEVIRDADMQEVGNP